MIRNKKHIIWDWNGTLLNDLEICILAMNHLLQERTIPLLTEIRYKDIFCFPVRNYYEKIGFDFRKESFEKVGLEFMDRYRKIVNRATLTKNAQYVLSQLQKTGVRQYVLSAMRQELLQQMLIDYGIIRYFDAVYGTKDDYGSGKIESGYCLLSELQLEKNQTVIIGDTLHDAEVADIMNVSCVLFSGGHQNERQLQKANKTIISDLMQLII